MFIPDLSTFLGGVEHIYRIKSMDGTAEAAAAATEFGKIEEKENE